MPWEATNGTEFLRRNEANGGRALHATQVESYDQDEPLRFALQVLSVALEDETEVQQHAPDDRQHHAGEALLHGKVGRTVQRWNEVERSHALEESAHAAGPRHVCGRDDVGDE